MPPVDRPLQAGSEVNVGPEAEFLLGPADVEAATRLTIGLGPIPPDLALIRHQLARESRRLPQIVVSRPGRENICGASRRQRGDYVRAKEASPPSDGYAAPAPERRCTTAVGALPRIPHFARPIITRRHNRVSATTG